MKRLLILTLVLLPYQVIAETATSGNLLPNAGTGSNTSTQKSGTSLDNVNANSGFTLNGVHGFNDELEAMGTGTASATGSLENITTTTQSGNSFTTTTDSLDGGVTLNAISEVQNCEWSQSQWRCGQSYGGTPDSYTTTIKILDENDNVLSTTSITRTNDAGYRSNSYTYTDTITHNDTGARKWDWEWQGIDSQSPNSTGLLGPNLLGASLTATLLDINYTAISQEELTAINTAVAGIETVSSELEELKIEEEIKVEELELEQPTISTEIAIEEEIMIEEIKELEEVKVTEVEMEVFKELFVENFTAILEEENLVEEFEEMLVEEAITEEEFFEETVSMVVESLEEPTSTFSTEEPKTEMKEPEAMEEEVVQSEEPVATENNSIETSSGPTSEENQPEKEEVQSSENETVSTETETTETTQEENTSATSQPETETQSEETSTEGDTETESEEVSNESSMDEDTTSENTPTQEGGEESNVDEAEDVSESSTSITEVDTIGEKVAKIIAKVEEKLKKVSDRVRAVQIITLKGIQTDGPNLESYASKSFYSDRQMNGVPNPDFFQTINILEQQQIYADARLAYRDNDPIAVKQSMLIDINNKKNKLIRELRDLKR